MFSFTLLFLLVSATFPSALRSVPLAGAEGSHEKHRYGEDDGISAGECGEKDVCV